MMIVSTVPSELLDTVWEQAGPLLAKSLDAYPGKTDIGDIMAELASGALALWIVVDQEADGKIVAVCTTRIARVHSGKILRLDNCGGSRMSEWLDPLMDRLFEYGTRCGCIYVEAVGRKGWVRQLKKHGMKLNAVVVGKELRNGQG